MLQRTNYKWIGSIISKQTGSEEMDCTIVMPDYFFWDIHGIVVRVDG